jgi:RHS repeat-associated protein
MLQLTDLRGNVIADATTSSTATSLSDTFEQTEFGQPRSNAPRYGWLGAGQRARDSATGLVIMGARLYSPSVGRFLESDPVQGGSANAYDYSNQDPVNGSDLSGEAPNGCGSGGALNWIIDGITPFKGACNFHDRCYGTWGVFKPTCDTILYSKMLVVCYKDYGADSTFDFLFPRVADSFYSIVSTTSWGRDAFNSTQLDVCKQDSEYYIHPTLRQIFYYHWLTLGQTRWHSVFVACWSSISRRNF